jgi:hypothetical protein
VVVATAVAAVVPTGMIVPAAVVLAALDIQHCSGVNSASQHGMPFVEFPVKQHDEHVYRCMSKQTTSRAQSPGWAFAISCAPCS